MILRSLSNILTVIKSNCRDVITEMIFDVCVLILTLQIILPSCQIILNSTSILNSGDMFRVKLARVVMWGAAQFKCCL